MIGNRYHGSIWAFKGIPDGKNDGVTISSADFPYFPYPLGTEGIDWDVLWVVKTEGEVWSTPAIADVDVDGVLEVMIGSADGKLYIIDGENGIVETAILIGSSIYASAALANLDADAYLEIVVGATDGKIYCFQWDGKIVKPEWSYPTGGAIYSSASVGDVDGDGSLEIVVGSTDGKIYCLSSLGSPKWSYPTGGAIYSSPALANRGTEGLGIYVGSNDAYLYLISGTGSLIDRFLTYGQIRTSPAVADIDGDGKLEIVFYDWSSYDTLWCLEDVGSSVGKYAIEWQMFRHDAMRRGLYTPVLPDLTIVDVKPVQVIWDCDINGDGRIDLVAGKPTMVQVTIGIKNYETFNKDTIIEIRLVMPFIVRTEYRTIKELEKNNKVNFYVLEEDPDFYLFTLIPPGDYEILTIVDSKNAIEEVDETNNEKSVEITIKDTRGLYLTYLPVYAHMLQPGGCDPPWGYGPLNLEEYSKAVGNSGKFILATYPITATEFTNRERDEKYYGSPVPVFGMLDDAISVYIWGKLLEPSTDRVVGIVPDDYFAFHKMPGVIGKAFPGVSGVLVNVNYWTTTAHEIGHTYGLPAGIHVWPLCIPGEEYDATVGRPANGFWVEGDKEVKDSICFMGAALYDHFPENITNYFGAWICNECYNHLFGEFRHDKKDPEILLVNGIMFKNGTIQLGKWYWLKEGSVSHVCPGNYSIQIIDFNGTLISETLFAAPFATYVDPIGVIETNITGFAFAIPFPDTTSTIQIRYNNETIITLNPNTKILHDAIDSIPDHGFVDNPKRVGRRKALHNKIDAIEQMLAENNIIGARNKLKFDVKDKLQKWLVDDYEKTNPLQLTKDEVLALIDEIVNRLNIQIEKRILSFLEDLQAEIEVFPNEAFNGPMTPDELRAMLLQHITDIINNVQAQMDEIAISQLKSVQDEVNQWTTDPWREDLLEKIEAVMDLLVPQLKQ